MTITWSDPGCFPVTEGVHRIPLQMPGDGLRAINVYALETDAGLALIDGGWRRETTYDEISAALDRIGSTAGEIHDIYITHVHRDHYTFAVELRRRHGCRIHLGAAEVVGIEAIATLGSNVPESSLRELNRAGAVQIAEQAYKDTIGEPFDAADWEPPDTWLPEGPLNLPGHNLTAVHTPGHTKGHMVFHDLDRGVSYTGDHVLPTITPSIGFELGDWDLPLAKYLRSLELLLDDRDRIMLPSHGDPGSGVHARVHELLAHHKRRFGATTAVVAGLGASTGLAVAQALTWTRHERRFDTLDNFNQMVATCETLAHLDVLADRGVLTVENREGVDVFTVR
jgi:glyoxylase-like metal-dependent hydrolase (beta-lactamase superfamily II)